MNFDSQYSRGIAGVIIVVSLFFFARVSAAQSPVSLAIDTAHPGYQIPPDFSGISIETGSLRSGNGGVLGNWFDDSTHWPIPMHAEMITLFNNLGIKNIRVGGGSVDVNNTIPTNADRDAFFRFVKAAGLKVEYSLRLLNGSITTDTTIAKYVWSNYGQYIKNFEIGNEPDFHSYHTYPGHTVDPAIVETQPGTPGSAFPSYMADWKKFAAAVTTAIPGAKFGGPDSGSNYPVPSANGKYSDTFYNGLPWTVQFMDSTMNLGSVTGIYFHNYVGAGASGTPMSMADGMLSSAWVTQYYPALYNSTCLPVIRQGLPYRITESNSFSGSLTGGSDCYATSLFSLDYMHWWAEHQAAGVNFHNKQWVLNDAIYMEPNGNYQVHPMAYGIAAFKISGHGRVDSVGMSNPDNLDLTAYAVTDSNGRTFVTVINKEHASTAPYATVPRNAEVSIKAVGLSDTASVIYLSVPGRNVLATSGMTLGHETIMNDTPFVPKWSPLDTSEAGYYTLRVPYATAAVVRIGGPFVKVQSSFPVSPSGDTGVARQTTLTWNSSSATSGYEVQVSPDSAFDSIVYDTTTSAADTTVRLSSPLNADTKYFWRVMTLDSLFTSSYSQAHSFTTGTGLLSVLSPAGVPRKFALEQNFPNPFNPSTEITFSLEHPGDVSLDIYNILGQLVNRVAGGYKSAGKYSYDVNMDSFASGVYFYTLRQGANAITRKMLLLK